MPNESLTNIGIQLFSLPKLLDQDFLSAVKLLQQMVYGIIKPIINYQHGQ